jgi:hypothetical protein
MPASDTTLIAAIDDIGGPADREELSRHRVAGSRRGSIAKN